MTLVDIDILNAASNLEITQEEVENVMTGVFRSAIIGAMLVYMIWGFGKGIGMSKKEEMKYVKMAREL